VFGMKISEGAIAKMLARTETSFAAEADKIAATVREVIASDETSARVKGKTWWQWIMNARSPNGYIV
jgi:transposase